MVSLPTSVTQMRGPLDALAVCNRHARATIFLHGAHVASWRPVGEAEVLWMSVRSWLEDSKPIRGGVPICFPWFGPNGSKPELPAHGFARLLPWALAGAEDLDDGATQVTLTFASSAETEAMWPHRFSATYVVTVAATLNLTLTVRNTGDSAFSFEEALHTYLDVADVQRIGIEGLTGASYVDKVSGQSAVETGERLKISQETDRVFPEASGSCTLVDPLLGRRINVAKSGSQTTVVWNPWSAKAARMPDFGDHEWRGMMCIEAANSGAQRQTLPPGASHSLSQTLAVER